MTFFKKYRLLIAILSVVIFVFGISVRAYADLTLTGTSDTAATVFYSYMGSPYTSDNVIQTWQATGDGTISDVKGYYKAGGDAGSSIIYLWGTWDTEIEARNNCAAGDYISRYDYASKPATKTYITWPKTDGTGAVENGKYYCFQFGASGAGGDGQAWVYGSTTNDYENGMATTTAVFQYPADQMNGVVDFALEITGQEAPPADEIEITYPTSTAAGDFENWEITFDTTTSTTATTTDAYVAQLFAIYSSSTEAQTLAGIKGADIIHSFQSPKEIENLAVFGEGTLYAHAKMFYQPDRFENPDIIYQVATSSVVNFTITPTSYAMGFYEMPTGTSTSAEWTFTCDPESDLFSRSLCNLARFLFVPTPASIQRFGNLQDTISEKPPFGYWTEIKGEILTITTTTAAFTLTGVSVLAENETFKTIKTTISVILWFLFAFWILHRVRLFDFQK